MNVKNETEMEELSSNTSESSPYMLFPECKTDDMRLLAEGSDENTEIKPYIEEYKESIELKSKSKACLIL